MTLPELANTWTVTFELAGPVSPPGLHRGRVRNFRDRWGVSQRVVGGRRRVTHPQKPEARITTFESHRHSRIQCAGARRKLEPAFAASGSAEATPTAAAIVVRINLIAFLCSGFPRVLIVNVATAELPCEPITAQDESVPSMR